MKLFATKPCNKCTFIEQVKDFMIALYMILMMVTVLAVLMETKIYYQIDVVPGLDIPIDEWYAQAMHR